MRSLRTEGRATLGVYNDVVPEEAATTARLNPLLAAAYGQGRSATLDATLPLYENRIAPAIGRVQRQATRDQRSADVQDFADFGPAASAAVDGFTPEAAAALRQLTNMAIADLNAGSELDARQRRDISVASRSMAADRGFGFSDADIAEEVMALAMGGDNLRTQRMGRAADVIRANQSFYDPAMFIMGQRADVSREAQQFQDGVRMDQQAGTRSFNPYADPYAQDAFDSNFNAGWQAIFHQDAMNEAKKKRSYDFAGGIIEGALGGLGAAAAAIW
jgi:hypothetical protein